MSAVHITLQNTTPDGWNFLVSLENAEFSVTLEKDYWKGLTGSSGEPSELVRRSFLFLLKHEPKESILRSFNLKKIQQYFPEYEKTMRAHFSKNSSS